MGRVTQPEGGKDFPDLNLRDWDPYVAHIKSIDSRVREGRYVQDESKPGRRLQVIWELEGPDYDGLDLWVWDWMDARLGTNSSGQIAKLRVLINAIHGRPQGQDIGWFDDETFEYSFDKDGPTHGRLQPGMRALFRGVNEVPEGQTEPRFRIKTYQTPPPATTTAQVQAPAPAAAPAPAPATPVPAVPVPPSAPAPALPVAVPAPAPAPAVVAPTSAPAPAAPVQPSLVDF